MDSILLIEDQIVMMQFIQRYLQDVNTDITDENVYGFNFTDDKAEILPLSELSKIYPDGGSLPFKRHQDAVIKKMKEFIQQHQKNKSQVFIMIDVLLNSLNASAPTLAKYKQNAEYSHQLYIELLKGFYSEKYQKKERINPNNYDFTLYSRSSASRSIIAVMLTEYYEMLKNEAEDEANENEKNNTNKSEKKEVFNELNFPFYSEPNIKWCKNRCEQTADGQPIPANPALSLPASYVKYISTVLNMK